MRRDIRQLEQLESRRLLAAVYPTIYEQYMVELHNWARANPQAAADRYGVALNEGPTAQPLSSDPKQPLAINPFLTDSARSFAQWMIDHDLFGHTVDGSTPQARMAAAGYVFAGAYASSENAQLHGVGSAPNLTAAVDADFAGYYKDLSVPGRWHRINLMDANMKEVGSGIATGNFQGLNCFISLLNYAYSGTGSFLTGVAYTDTSQNDFYTPGEQIAGVQIIAIRNSDGAQFTTTTWSSGGYSLALPAGTYTVWASGGTLGGWVRHDEVTLGAQNVKRDFRPDKVNSQTGPGGTPSNDPDFITRHNGRITIRGTDADDVLTLVVVDGSLQIARNGQSYSYPAAEFTAISVLAGNGNDAIQIGSGVIGCRLNGEAGNDTISGGSGNDIIYGGEGNDSLLGGNGKDRIWGGAGQDLLYGGGHNDSLYGDSGHDSIWGQGQEDLLDGGLGADLLTGGPGIDTVTYCTRTNGVYVEISSRYDRATGKSGEANEKDNVLDDIENIIGGRGSDRLIGSHGPNLIRGGDGNDTIYGMNGADTIFGENGNDRTYAQDRSVDMLDGGDGRDIAYVDALDLLTRIEVS